MLCELIRFINQCNCHINNNNRRAAGWLGLSASNFARIMTIIRFIKQCNCQINNNNRRAADWV
jgi:hypothetical protein